MMARYYSQGYGRFLSPDPGYDYDQLDPMSWNLYSYVRENPVNYADENGAWRYPKNNKHLAFIVNLAKAMLNGFKDGNDMYAGCFNYFKFFGKVKEIDKDSEYYYKNFSRDGQGPEIYFIPITNSEGNVDPGIYGETPKYKGNDVVKLNFAFFKEALAWAGNNKNKKLAVYIFMASTLLHETAHWVNFSPDGKDSIPGHEGQRVEFQSINLPGYSSFYAWYSENKAILNSNLSLKQKLILLQKRTRKKKEKKKENE